METGQYGAPVFGVEARQGEHVTALTAAGRLVVGARTASAWPSAVELRGASRLVVDLQGVTAIDASGVGQLLRLRHAAARLGIPVVIETAAPRVQRVLALTHLDAVFGLVPGTAPSGAGLDCAVLSRCA